MARIELGDEVQDLVSGFKGVAVGRTQWLYGCERIIVTPRMGKDGKVGENMSFDEPQLKLLKAKTIKTKVEKKGGDRPTPQMKITPKRF